VVNIGLYAAFVAATVVLIAIPGPTVMLVTSITLGRGIRAGLTAVAGSALAAAVCLSIIVAGIASVIAMFREWFVVLRWIGAIYLIYLGLRAWLSASPDENSVAMRVSSVRDFGQGFLTTLTNPKTLLFLSAFFPQFIDPALPALGQLLILSATFLVLLAALDTCWVCLASAIGAKLRGERFKRLCDRIGGSILIGAGASLALDRRV
jgi:threonine/homoserine/homoserine lactone efflux protein